MFWFNISVYLFVLISGLDNLLQIDWSYANLVFFLSSAFTALIAAYHDIFIKMYHYINSLFEEEEPLNKDTKNSSIPKPLTNSKAELLISKEMEYIYDINHNQGPAVHRTDCTAVQEWMKSLNTKV